MMPAIRRELVLALAAGLLTAHSISAQNAREEGLNAFAQGRYSVALQRFSEAVKDPADHVSTIFLVLTQAARGDCQTALPALASSKPTDPSMAKLVGLASVKCYDAKGDSLHATATLSELKRRFPSDADVLYTEAKQHMKAFNDATYAMFQRTPSSYRVHELSAEIFETQNRFNDAVTEYRKAIELNPRAPDLHFRLGRAIMLASHDTQALASAQAAFETELQLNPEDAATEFQLGQIAQVQSRTTDARRHFQQALKLSPSFIEALIAIGKMDSQDKNYGSAIALLQRATQAQPSNERAHYALLTAYRNAGQLDKAKAEKAILDKLQRPPEGEFSDFLKRLGEDHSTPAQPTQ